MAEMAYRGFLSALATDKQEYWKQIRGFADFIRSQ
jgi:hypothetical protein